MLFIGQLMLVYSVQTKELLENLSQKETSLSLISLQGQTMTNRFQQIVVAQAVHMPLLRAVETGAWLISLLNQMDRINDVRLNYWITKWIESIEQ